MARKDAEDDAANGIMPVLLLKVSSGGLSPRPNACKRNGEGGGG